MFFWGQSELLAHSCDVWLISVNFLCQVRLYNLFLLRCCSLDHVLLLPLASSRFTVHFLAGSVFLSKANSLLMNSGASREAFNLNLCLPSLFDSTVCSCQKWSDSLESGFYSFQTNDSFLHECVIPMCTLWRAVLMFFQMGPKRQKWLVITIIFFNMS